MGQQAEPLRPAKLTVRLAGMPLVGTNQTSFDGDQNVRRC
jgi:hypothetical protein